MAVPISAKQSVLKAIEDKQPKPTELLDLLSDQLSYGDIQDTLSELLETGTVELVENWRLRVVHHSVAAD